MEWDRGFWGRDGRIIRGETRSGSGRFKALNGAAEMEFVGEREAISASPALAVRPLLRLNPPKAPGSSVLRPKLRLNPPNKMLGSKMSAGAGVKKRRKGTVRSRPVGR